MEFNAWWAVGIFAVFCHFSINLVLRSLLLGLIWEVFIIVSAKDNLVEDLIDKDAKHFDELTKMLEEEFGDPD